MSIDKAFVATILGGLSAFGLASCDTVEGDPAGGTARDANYAEAHCQKFGKHASIDGMINSTEYLSFTCVAGRSGDVDGTAPEPQYAESTCQAQGKHATIRWALSGIQSVGYDCLGGARAKPVFK